MFSIRQIALLSVVFILVIGQPVIGQLALAASVGEAQWLPAAEKQLKSWQKDLENWQKSPPALEEVEARQNEAFLLKEKADDCATELTGEVGLIQEKITALGQQAEDEAGDIKTRRKALNQEKQAIEADLAVCKLVSLGVRELQDGHKSLRNRLVSKSLSHRLQPMWSLMYKQLNDPQIIEDGYQFKFEYWPSLMAGVIVLFILWPSARYFSLILIRQHTADTAQSSDAALFFRMLSKRLPWIAFLASVVAFAYLSGIVLLGAVILAVIVSMLLAPPLQLLLCNKMNQCREGLPARLLLDLVLIGVALHFAGIQTLLTTEALFIANAAYSALMMMIALWLMLLLSRRESFQLLHTFRTPLAMAMIAGPLAMWLGYVPLAKLLIPGVYGTLVGLLIAWTVFNVGSLFFRQLDPSDAENMPLRQFLGYQKDETVPGLWLGRLLLLLLVIGGFSYWLLLAWNVPHSEINAIGAFFTDGFPVGAITIVPSKIIAAILAFFLLLTFARWLRNQLSERWLTKTRLDIGVRESIVSLTMYAIVGIALVIALSMAGVDFQNIAIVAGALSVGIGFGLQNIVNNFVSGLILLFERPVKPGDWVVVGATEGHVKKISIRYTLIQTFDRADVLVPNSELISNQVTNWMHRDAIGRVIVPVGVAYGTDTQLVKEILLKIANQHPMVLTHDFRVDAPQVRFMGFGESSLDFELRCFIKHVDNRLSAKSDLLFSIDEAFRQADIEIPFPQRVLHMAEDGDQRPEDLPADASKNIQDNIPGNDQYSDKEDKR